MTEMAIEYGEVAHVRNRNRDFIVISGHEAAKHVLITNQDNYRKGLEYELLRIVLGEGLLTSEGETWRKQRRLVQPMFAKRYLKNFTAHMTRATAEVLAGYIRNHWGIENGLHWALDVSFREDESRARAGHAGANLGVVRRVAASLLKRADTKGSIQTRRMKAAWDDYYMLKVLQEIRAK